MSTEYFGAKESERFGAALCVRGREGNSARLSAVYFEAMTSGRVGIEGVLSRAERGIFRSEKAERVGTGILGRIVNDIFRSDEAGRFGAALCVRGIEGNSARLFGGVFRSEKTGRVGTEEDSGQN